MNGTMQETKVYSYVIAHAGKSGKTTEVTSVLPPDELLQILDAFAELLGYKWKDIPIAIYARVGEGAMWQPISGVSDTTPTLIPVPPGAGDTEIFSDEDCFVLGQQVLDAYRELQNRSVKVRNARRLEDTQERIQQLLNEFETLMGTVESVVEGTEWARVFDLKCRRREKQYVAAKILHMSPRTWNRYVHDMTIYIGRVLHDTLPPRRLHEITQYSRRRR
ncbi:MAG: hypothetical protein K6T83_00300 [Alicyclobacillus sp.]|nr:hypothetical protein [Alicyclobacillus sp.]